MKAVQAPLFFDPIGTIRTPYTEENFCPEQPVERPEGESRLIVWPEYKDLLSDLQEFKYIYVISHLHKGQSFAQRVKPGWANGQEIGTFASRSPNRPVPIGLSIVRLKKIEGSTITTSPMDVFDNTPLLDIKPYLRNLDAKTNANHGWIEKIPHFEHLLEHVRGLPHDHRKFHHEHKIS
jgi:tRNA-Thr(GGU) m(6)t(6)A37 methyltransferase TsaA